MTRWRPGRRPAVPFWKSEAGKGLAGKALPRRMSFPAILIVAGKALPGEGLGPCQSFWRHCRCQNITVFNRQLDAIRRRQVDPHMRGDEI